MLIKAIKRHNIYKIGFIYFLTFIIFSSCSSYDDSSLLKLFTENKETLLEILAMQKEDERLVRIAPSFTRLDNDWNWPRENIGISNERWDQYKRLFLKAHLDDGIEKYGPYVWFFVASSGLAIGGTSKGFVYTDEKPNNIVQCFNECHFSKENQVCFVHIEDGWYIFEWKN